MKVKLNILIVEDNPGDLELIKEHLNSAIFEGKLFNAEKLNNAIKIVNENLIDVVLLDLNLPDSNGFDTFLNFKNAIDEVAIILLTGLEDNEIGYKAVEEGAQDFIVKNKLSE